MLACNTGLQSCNRLLNDCLYAYTSDLTGTVGQGSRISTPYLCNLEKQIQRSKYSMEVCQSFKQGHANGELREKSHSQQNPIACCGLEVPQIVWIPVSSSPHHLRSQSIQILDAVRSLLTHQPHRIGDSLAISKLPTPKLHNHACSIEGTGQTSNIQLAQLSTS